MLFKPGSPRWLLPFCNARCIVAKEEKPHGQECPLAHRQGEEVRETRRGLVLAIRPTSAFEFPLLRRRRNQLQPEVSSSRCS